MDDEKLGKGFLGNRPFKDPIQNFAYNVIWLGFAFWFWEWLWPKDIFDTGLGNLTIGMIFRMIVCILIGIPMFTASIAGIFLSAHDASQKDQ